MNVTLIGAGNLSTSLGHALCAAGHDIRQVWSRTMESAKLLGDALECEAVNRLECLNADSDAYIVSLRDDAIRPLLPEICRDRVGSVFLHTAGSLPLHLFEGHCQHYGVLYPMQTFSKQKILPFNDIPVFVEGNDEQSYRLSRQLAESISQHVIDLDSEQRRRLHLAAVFACNFVNHCYAISDEILERAGIPFDVMLPLIDETARKVHTLRPHEAQTGPAIRYDEKVINMQADMLRDMSTARDIYLLMSRSIHDANTLL